LKKGQIETYFDSIRDQILTFSEDRMVVDAMREFKSGFNSYRDQTEIDSDRIAVLRRELNSYYTGEFSAEYCKQNDGTSPNAERFLAPLDDDSVAPIPILWDPSTTSISPMKIPTIVVCMA